MCHKRSQQRGAGSKQVAMQRGFSIVSAIFLLVVLSALGAFMVTFSSVQHTTSAQDVQGARAYQAARAGVEWGAYQILQNNPAGFAAACRTAAALPPMPTLGGTLSAFAVNVNCTATSYTEGAHTAANPLWMYRVTSTASTGNLGETHYVEREIQVTIEK